MNPPCPLCELLAGSRRVAASRGEGIYAVRRRRRKGRKQNQLLLRIRGIFLTMAQPTALEQLVAGYPSVLVGYSGGVDSALLAVVARRTLGRDRTVAAIGVSASLAESQRQQAAGIARTFDLELVELATDELDDPEYAANPTN